MSANQLQTGKINIDSLFDAKAFYNIPDYQRPYVWEEEQIHTLLDDIANAYENNADKEYFLGSMIWNSRAEESNKTSYIVRDILDGQQRFITIFLLFAVIRDTTNNLGLKLTVENALSQKANQFKNLPQRDRIAFAVRKDASFIADYIVSPQTPININNMVAYAQITKTSTDRSVKNMAKAVISISLWWKQKNKFIKNTEEAGKYLIDFFTYLYSKVVILYLETSDSLDDAYTLFTTLNSSGIKLLASDLLKAQNLKALPNEASRNEYAKQWDNIEETLEKCEGLDLDGLLRLVLDAEMKYNGDGNKTLQQGFSVLKNTEKIFGENFFKTIFEYSQVYLDIINGNNSNTFKSLVNIARNTMGNGSKIFLALAYYKKHFGSYRIDDFFIKIENLCSLIWMLARTNSISTRVFHILKRIEYLFVNYSKAEDAADELLQDSCLLYDFVLDSSKTNLLGKISLDEFKTELIQNDWGDYGGVQKNKTKYLLLKLDFIHASKETYFFNSEKSKISIEHILPRKPANNTWINFSQDVHEKWVHRLGNLILINKNTNSSISNSEYAKKRKEYSGHYENRAYTNYVFINHSTWTPKELEANHNRAVNLLIKYYEGNSLQAFLELKKSLSK